jgi:Mg2+ and Co2+ transporter CorA
LKQELIRVKEEQERSKDDIRRGFAKEIDELKAKMNRMSVADERVKLADLREELANLQRTYWHSAHLANLSARNYQPSITAPLQKSPEKPPVVNATPAQVRNVLYPLTTEPESFPRVVETT